MLAHWAFASLAVLDNLKPWHELAQASLLEQSQRGELAKSLATTRHENKASEDHLVPDKMSVDSRDQLN